MPSSKPQQGINDLCTLFPDIAKEADSWGASEVLATTHKKMRWKCKEWNRNFYFLIVRVHKSNIFSTFSLILNFPLKRTSPCYY